MAIGLTGSVVDSAVSYPSLAAAGTVTLNDSDFHVVVITTSSPIATGTIKMCAAPFDGQFVDVRADGTITTLTVDGNGNTAKNAPTTLATGGTMTAVYRASNTTWYF